MLPGQLKPSPQKRRPLLVAIVGGSGAGKSWLAEQLQRHFGKEAARLSLDDFYRDRSHLAARQRERVNFDHPRAIDWPLVLQVLEGCANGRSLRAPRYSFAEHVRLPDWNLWQPRPLILVEGLWLLRTRRLRRLFDFTIFLDCPERTRLERRLRRDILERSRSEEGTRQQFYARVLPMHARYVDPQRIWADVVFTRPLDRRAVRKVVAIIQRRLAGA